MSLAVLSLVSDGFESSILMSSLLSSDSSESLNPFTFSFISGDTFSSSSSSRSDVAFVVVSTGALLISGDRMNEGKN